MEINLMTLEQIEERKAEIEQLLETDGADLDALTTEIEQLKTRKAELIAERKAILEEVSQMQDEETTIIERGDTKPMAKTLKEVLQSAEYENAYARYIKTEDETEVRALLTELVDTYGTVPVPTYLEERIMTAWDNSEMFSRINKSYIKGIIRQGFELSASGAAVHNEGANAPDEETLTIGVVEISPKMLKKWISISDEVMDMTGRTFLDYIYDEIEYRIVKLAEERAVSVIKSLSTSASSSAVSVKNYSGEPSADLCIMAEALLSDEARNPVFIANKQTIAQFKSLTTADGYLINNPFNNMPVIAQNSLPSYETASAGAVYAIIGDLSAFRANFPNGTEVKFKFDDLSLAEKDLVKIVGRMYVGMNVVACDRFVLVKKPVVSG